MNNIALGKRGESYAASFLEENGYKIIIRNFISKTGEIDIIAEENDLLVFVEVKTRRTFRYGLPCESVTTEKRRHIIKTALSFIAADRSLGKRFLYHDFRIDVIEINIDNLTNQMKINHIKNAIMPE